MLIERDYVIKGLLLFHTDKHRDDRGYFTEVYHADRYAEYLPKGTRFIQDNLSYSDFGVIRGLHFQVSPHAQAKLVRCVLGRIIDIAVDLRPGSSTLGQHASIELSEANGLQLFIPKGFAHGFEVISEKAMVEYKCDEYYHPGAERGIRYDDPLLGIDWKVPVAKRIISPKDLAFPTFKRIEFIDQ